MQIRIDESGQELKTHGTHEFPLLVSHEALSNYERRTFLWHWHAELEWTYIEEGEISYSIHDQTFHLKKGQGILCNSNVLHMGKAENDRDCRYVSITVHPRFFCGFADSFLNQRYVEPVLDQLAFAYVVLGENAWEQRVLGRLRQIEQLDREHPENYEFQIYLLMMENWLDVWEGAWKPENLQQAQSADSRNVERLKTIFHYLHEHYAEKITLKQVAEQVNLCEAEVCRLFKRYMKESLFEYLMDYRIERSKEFLLNRTITDAASGSGFSSPAYYTKVFKERMGCTPREYQQAVREHRKAEGEENIHGSILL